MLVKFFPSGEEQAIIEAAGEAMRRHPDTDGVRFVLPWDDVPVDYSDAGVAAGMAMKTWVGSAFGTTVAFEGVAWDAVCIEWSATRMFVGDFGHLRPASMDASTG